MDLRHRARVLAVAALVAVSLFGIGLAHGGVGAGDHTRTAHDHDRPADTEHCVVCTAVCVGGLGAVLMGVGLARRRRRRGPTAASQRVPSFLWAWVLDRPPQQAPA